MRKLIVSMNLTLDGFMAGPSCELDWHFQHWNNEMGDALAAELYKADCLLFGRITYCGMMKHWEILERNDLLSRGDLGFFTQVAHCSKLVCSNTLTKAAWKNSILLKGDLKKQLVKLKQTGSKNIMVYGSGQLVSLLMQLNLIDEFQLWLHPVLLGKGKPLFKDQKNLNGMKLLKTKTFSTGVVLLCYACGGEQSGK